MKRYTFIAVLSALAIISCKKERDIQFDDTVKAALSIEFDNIVGQSDLQLLTGIYTNSSGEKFSVNKLKYYISNISLTNISGKVYTIPQDSSYFLMDESVRNRAVVYLPEGIYSTLKFTIGVDSLRNTKDISERTGVLDPAGAAADMYWGWNSGYIFFKMEGTSSSITTADHLFNYHVGGFGGYSTATVNNLKNISIDLSARGVVKVVAGRTPNVHLFVDLLKIFDAETKIQLSQLNMVHSAAAGIPIAANYSTMFVHDHTEN